MHKFILVPVALDHESLISAKIATARSILEDGGRIMLLTVLEDVPAVTQEFMTIKQADHLTARMHERLLELTEGADDMEVMVTTGKPGVRIVDVAKDTGADLIIVGAHHPRAMDYFLGSTASRVARRATCSVYIQRAAE